MNLEQLKDLLRKHNMRPNATYGQNFLIDDIVLQDIVDAAEVTKEDAVLEIGPGIGNLTEKLCERAGFVLSLEKDPKFFPILHGIKKDHKDNFRFEITDALDYNFQDFFKKLIADSNRIHSGAKGSLERGGSEVLEGENPFSGLPLQDGYKVVANIPYYITGKILQMLLTAKFKPTSITVLTQKEVAENLSAEAGKLGILAISVQLFGQPKFVQKVLARSFYPAPKVDSAIIRVDLFKKLKYEIEDEKKFFKIIKACFAGKRKQIHNTLVNNLHLEKEQALKILSEIKVPPTARPQELTIEQWVELEKKLNKI